MRFKNRAFNVTDRDYLPTHTDTKNLFAVCWLALLLGLEAGVAVDEYS